MAKKSNFLIRRLHSLTGIIPIGIFLCFHLLINSGAFGGEANYVMTIEFMRGLPLISVLEIIIIAIPILFHAIYGIYIVYVAKNNALRYNYLRNWFYTLQRVTAVVTVLFLIFHVLTLRVFSHDAVNVVSVLAGHLQNPFFFVLYCLCVMAAIFHFSNGLFTFLITWGVIQGPRVQKIALWVTIVIFVAMSIWAVSILYSISTFPMMSTFFR